MHLMDVHRHVRALTFLSLCLLASVLSGCAQVGVGGSTVSKPALAIDATDPCGQERTEFAQSKTYFTDEIIGGIGTGAIVGAVVGGVGGAVLRMNPLETAAIGAGVGAAAGGVTSYSKVMAQKHQDQAELAKSVNDDLTKEGQEIDHTAATFARLRSCRFQQASLIKTQVRSRRIDRPTAIQQLTIEKNYFAEEIALAKQYQVSMDKRGSQFKDAADEINQQAAADAAQAAVLQATKQAAAVSIPNKRASFGKEVTTAEANGDIAFNLDNNKKVSSVTVPADA